LGTTIVVFPAHPHVLLLVMNKIGKRLQHVIIHLVPAYPFLEAVSNEMCEFSNSNNAIATTIQPLPVSRKTSASAFTQL